MARDGQPESAPPDVRAVLSKYQICLKAMVGEGIVAPIGGGVIKWRFTRNSVVRVRTVMRMQRDLRVNLAGAALALDLLERIEALNERLKSFEPPPRR